jgi:pyridoxamine 5'-phosphate oxidase
LVSAFARVARLDSFPPLLERELAPDPVDQFAAWFRAAGEVGVRLPEAVVLATATPDGAPSVRAVLLKGFDAAGFVFYTNYESRKGRELAANPRAALLFYWDPLGRQVRIEGRVAKVSPEESDAYFATRPLGSRLGALASPQSAVIDGRGELERRVAELDARYAGREPPRPPQWGGYRLAHEAVEFWQHREDRLHDRLRYRRSRERWIVERLAP